MLSVIRFIRIFYLNVKDYIICCSLLICVLHRNQFWFQLNVHGAFAIRLVFKHLVHNVNLFSVYVRSFTAMESCLLK